MRKKCFLIVLLLSLLFTSTAPVFHSAQADTQYAVIKQDKVNVRTGPGLSYPVMKSVRYGEKYPIVARKGDWVKIQLKQGSSGWVADWLLSVETELQKKDYVVSTTTGLRIRSGPGTNYKVVGQFPKGEKAHVLMKQGKWVKISYNGRQGWVSSAYVAPAASKTPSNQKHSLGTVTATILNVRSKPNAQSSITGKLTKNMKVEIISEQGNWYKIRYNNVTGWVSKQYITKAAAKSSSTSPQKGRITASSLNVRSGPSLHSKIVGTIKKGTEVEIIGANGDWYQIRYAKNKTGWASKRYIEAGSKKTNGAQSVVLLYDGTNLRSAPSTSAKIVQRGNKGQTFPIVGIYNNWYKIQLRNGQTAYVASWVVTTTSENNSNKGTSIPSNGKKVIIDPGHGGYDSGTIGVRGTLEKHLTLKTAKLVYNKLKRAGVNAVLTRSDDTYISLQSRVGISVKNNANAFVSIHYNSSIIPSANGITTFYYNSAKDKALANVIHKEMVRHVNLRNRGVQFGNYFVLRENKRPAALLELGFLSNPMEEWTVSTNAYQEKISQAIYKAVVKYVNS